ncbi:hypothetical protein [Mesorhizobium tianshanense]|uniref:hypothetical protein n=1 Tax=Mesorhizobium tianshanense TaxID=39844 RepID=UPI0011A95F32|nr:hypothetical protein [Mesorhizobium tianshanense]
MKELKGGIGAFAGCFPGFGCVLIGLAADRLNLTRPQDRLFLSCGSEPFSNRDPDAVLLSGFGHIVAFGSRLPILLKSAAWTCRAR